MTQVQRQLGIFRNMLIYAGIRNTPNPLPFPHLDPIDEFWQCSVGQCLTYTEEESIDDRILQAAQKVAEETAWQFNSDIACSSLSVSEDTSFKQLYWDWFILIMEPKPLVA